MYENSRVYQPRTGTCRLPGIAQPMPASGEKLTADRAAWPNLRLNFARLLPRSSAAPVVCERPPQCPAGPNSLPSQHMNDEPHVTDCCGCALCGDRRPL
jgi:hypothetical protein